MNRQLVFVNGKLNELMLPKRASKQRGRQRKELISAKEKWGRRKQKNKYYGSVADTTLLKQHYGNVVDELDFSGQGQCVKGCSLPRFHAVPGHRRFVQILNVGDYWICITNVFSSSTHDVFVFDSIYDSVSSSTQNTVADVVITASKR